MNWLDIVLVGIILLTTIIGLVKGLVRQIIGLLAVIAGLILASLYYGGVAAILEPLVHNKLLSHFLGFVIIFVCVLVAGSLLAHFITKAMKGPLALVNRLFGGAFGFIKSVLICGVIVFALSVFNVAKPALEESALAPFCLAITRAAVNLVPQDLRTKFNESYNEIRKRGGKHGEKI